VNKEEGEDKCASLLLIIYADKKINTT